MKISHELQIGRAGQYLTLFDLMMNGVKSYPTEEGVNYDVVADIGTRLIRLQVKTTQKPNTSYKQKRPIYFYHVRRAGKGASRYYEVGEFEGFALVAVDIKKVFYLKFTEKTKTSVSLRDNNYQYNGHQGGLRPGLYFQDLTWENFLKNL